MVSKHFLRAEALYQQKNYKLAIVSYRDALKEDPEDLDAMRMLAMALSVNDQDKDALREIKEVLRRAPDDDEAIFTSGLIHYNAKDHKQGEKLIKQALGMNPYNALAHLILSYIAEGKSNWKLMREEASKALELNPEYEDALIALAKAQTELGQKKEARQSLESALLINPNKAKTHAHLGRLMLHTGDPKGAREHLREALRLDPNNRDALEGFIESLRSKNIAYYWFITCIWAISRGPARFILFARIAHPSIVAIVLLFWYVVWFVREITTFALRFDKDVRHYLPPELIRRNNINLTILALITCLPYIGAWIGESQEASRLSEIKKAVAMHQTDKANKIEDQLYQDTLSTFADGRNYALRRPNLELLYQYELDRRPQDRSRLAYTALWLGMDSTRGAYPNEKLINQAQLLAQKTNNTSLFKYSQAAMVWAKYQNLPGKQKNKVECVSEPGWKDFAPKENATADQSSAKNPLEVKTP